MFNGIIYNQGILKKLKHSNGSCHIEISNNKAFTNIKIGSSIACDGVCLTLYKKKKNLSFFYLSKETLNKTTFKNAKEGKLINMENTLKFGDSVSGHYVQGHVDCTGIVKKITKNNKSWIIKIFIPNKFKKLLVYKSSITLNGVSLTISKIIKNYFEVTVIPHTLKLTNLMHLKTNNTLNIEFDIFSKYFFKLDK